MKVKVNTLCELRGHKWGHAHLLKPISDWGPVEFVCAVCKGRGVCKERKDHSRQDCKIKST